MKTIGIVFSIILAGITTCFAQTNVQKAPELLTLKETAYNFGKIQQGRPVTHVFEVANNSTDTLNIENVQASCGCTTPVWEKQPVTAGSSTKITVGYNAAAEGPFEKTVTIFYNGAQTRSVVIKGEVYKAPATPAPLNASIQLLKQ